jgi:hypothetical protein
VAKKTKKAFVPTLPPPSEILPPRGKTLCAAGGVLVLLGFLVLSRADALGRGAAAGICPFLILGGYVLIARGLWQRPSPPSPR